MGPRRKGSLPQHGRGLHFHRHPCLTGSAAPGGSGLQSSHSLKSRSPSLTSGDVDVDADEFAVGSGGASGFLQRGVGCEPTFDTEYHR
jgi:hypothetical protein